MLRLHKVKNSIYSEETEIFADTQRTRWDVRKIARKRAVKMHFHNILWDKINYKH